MLSPKGFVKGPCSYLAYLIAAIVSIETDFVVARAK